MQFATTAPRIDWKAERERIDLAAVATGLLGPAPGRRGESGRRLWWPCPFHEDQNPSFCIDSGSVWWHCFGCGEHGDAADLLMKIRGVTFPEAVRELTGGPVAIGKAPVRLAVKPTSKPAPQPSGLPEADALALVEPAEPSLWSPEGVDALAYLTGPRFLTPDTIRRARLGWTPRAEGVAWNPPGITIPWFDARGRLALVKVRPDDGWRERFPEGRRPPKYLQAYGNPARAVLYPSPAAIRPGHALVIVEGEFDALLLGQELAGLAVSVATLGSASSRPEAAAYLAMMAAPRWFLGTDADPAGDLAAEAWPARARRVRPPSPYKDWTEAKADGVNLARWWRDILNGVERPELFTWEELSTWRWGDNPEAPGIDAPRSTANLVAILTAALGPEAPS